MIFLLNKPRRVQAPDSTCRQLRPFWIVLNMTQSLIWKRIDFEKKKESGSRIFCAKHELPKVERCPLRLSGHVEWRSLRSNCIRLRVLIILEILRTFENDFIQFAINFLVTYTNNPY